MSLVRFESIEGHPLRVYDDLVSLPEIKHLNDMLMRSGFARTEVARPDTDAYRHWVAEVTPEIAAGLPVYGPTLNATRDFDGGGRYRIYRSYCNYAAYGDMLFTHTDCRPDDNDLTALWYIAPEWNVEWGGETLFYSSHHDAEIAVTPKPGRLVVFDGRIIHAGRPPNRICYVPRYTLAFKLEQSSS